MPIYIDTEGTRFQAIGALTRCKDDGEPGHSGLAPRMAFLSWHFGPWPPTRYEVGNCGPKEVYCGGAVFMGDVMASAWTWLPVAPSIEEPQQ